MTVLQPLCRIVVLVTKIIEISQEHLLAKIDAMKYSVLIPIQIKKDALRKKIAELGKA